jgi:hypothetical protein
MLDSTLESWAFIGFLEMAGIYRHERSDLSSVSSSTLRNRLLLRFLGGTALHPIFEKDG